MSITRRELLKVFGSATGLLAAGGAAGCELRWTREEAIAVDVLAQGRLPVLRLGVRDDGGAAAGKGGGRGGAPGRVESRAPMHQGADEPRDPLRGRPRPAPHGAQRRPAGARHVGRGDGRGGARLPRGHRRVGAGRRGLLRLRAVVHRGVVHGQQAVQGRHPHQQRGRQPAAVHGLGGLRLRAGLRQGRAARLLRGHRPRRLLLPLRRQPVRVPPAAVRADPAAPPHPPRTSGHRRGPAAHAHRRAARRCTWRRSRAPTCCCSTPWPR